MDPVYSVKKKLSHFFRATTMAFRALERGTDPAQASFRIAWSPCGRYIACGDDTPNSVNLARAWHAESGRAAYVVPVDDAADRYVVAIGFAGEQLIVVTRRGGLVYDAATGVLIKRIFVARWEVTCAHVSPLGRVTLCEDNDINDIRVIDVASGAELFATSARDASSDARHVHAVALSADGAKVAALMHRGLCHIDNASKLVVWDVTGGSTHTVEPVDHGHILEWAHRSDAIAFPVRDQLVVLRIAPDGTTTRDATAFSDIVENAAWAPDDGAIACVVGNDIVLARASDLSGPPLRTIALQAAAGHASGGTCVTFAPDGSAVATLEYWIPDPSDVDESPLHPGVRSLK